MIRVGAAALADMKQEVDALNVFPVPDGDTGTNMYLTILAAVREAEKIPAAPLGEMAAAVATGSLMGARGNSGVILSQLLRGIAKGLEGLTAADSMQIAQAMQHGVDTAYKAVMKPVEGTILTVARETAKGALTEAKRGASVLQTLEAAYRQGAEALTKTPDLLPVLKQAGVVDAGGKGWLVIVAGWVAALAGRAEAIAGQNLLGEGHPASPAVQFTFGQVESLEFPYCTEFLVKGENLPEAKIRQDLTGQGDCLMVVGTPEILKIHIHSNNPGKILDYAIKWGSLYEVQIHNMLAQNEAMAHARRAQGASGQNMRSGFSETGSQFGAATEDSSADVETRAGIVVVAMGQGIADVFKSLGADQVVTGGQTMNPSTEDLVAAVRQVRAKQVYILPNNKNIILAAGQVQELVDAEIYVVPSKSIPQGIAALIAFDSQTGADANRRKMERALSGVRSGEVTYAVRDSQYDGLAIHSGDILGLVDDTIVTAGRDILTVAQITLEKMAWRRADVVTVFFGDQVSGTDAQSLRAWLNRENPEVEVEVHAGGQPLYYYIFGVE